MRKFTKGSISTYVEDDDRRIKQYLANGWKEARLEQRPETPADERAKKAISDVADAEGGEGKKRKGCREDKKTNEALSSMETAAAESAPVDDGLFKREDEKCQK